MHNLHDAWFLCVSKFMYIRMYQTYGLNGCVLFDRFVSANSRNSTFMKCCVWSHWLRNAEQCLTNTRSRFVVCVCICVHCLILVRIYCTCTKCTHSMRCPLQVVTRRCWHHYWWNTLIYWRGSFSVKPTTLVWRIWWKWRSASLLSLNVFSSFWAKHLKAYGHKRIIAMTRCCTSSCCLRNRSMSLKRFLII